MNESKKIKNCSKFIILVSVISTIYPALAQDKIEGAAVAVDAGDRNKAKQRFSANASLSHMKSRHLDGVKGEEIIIDPEPPIERGIFQNARLDALHLYACKSAIFGEVELVGKKSFVGSDGEGVFTKLRFSKIDDWRPNNKKQVKIINLVVPGGDVEWEGERFRIVNKRANYQIKRHYILIAGNNTENSDNSTIFSNPLFLEVDNNAIYSPPGWTLFENGTTLKQAKADVAKVLGMRGCE